MKVKNLTPFPFATKLTARRPPQKEMTVVVRGAFALAPGKPLTPFENLAGQGPIKGEEWAEDDDDRAGEALYPGDFADFKLRGEVLLRGHCHAPGGRPTRECTVRFSVGAWSKSLRVVGRRVWSDGLIQKATEPHPFTSLPLDYAHAFGGPGYAKNPVGKGYDSMELPNVEDPGAPVRSPRDRVEPAGFGPLSSLWPQRAGKVGKDYGAAYRKTRAPFHPVDFDWTHFNAAPLDQQLEGYLRGDEEVSFENLHPEAARFSVRLPGLRIRVFWKDDRGDVREAPTSLDTLFADLDEGRLLLTWRGLTPVREEDLADVEWVLVASEPLADRPLPSAHYRALLDEFEKDPLGAEDFIQKHVPEAQREAARRVMRGEPPVVEVPPPAPDEPPADAVARMVQAGTGISDEVAATIRKGLADALAKAPQNDLGPALQRSLASTAEPSGGIAPVPGAVPKAPIAEALGRVREKLEALKKLSAEQNVPVRGLDQLEAMLADPRFAQLDPSYAAPGETPPPPLPDPGPGVDYAGRDLSGRNLSGADLRGANLEGAILSRTKLRGAQLVNARLSRAALDRADLEWADLSGADLTEAHFTEAHAPEARFVGATLDRAMLQKANLSGAVLDGAKASMVFANECDLRRARGRGVRFFKVVSQKSALEDADFAESELVECYFLECAARGLSLRGALLSRSSFGRSDLEDSSFALARGERTIFLGAKIGRADFGHAVLPWAHFVEAEGIAACFYGANLKEATFYRSALERADLRESNLLGANFGNAVLGGARFDGANLFEAHFLGSSGAGATFDRANLKRARFERA